jgi:hypothetical protein
MDDVDQTYFFGKYTCTINVKYTKSTNCILSKVVVLCICNVGQLPEILDGKYTHGDISPLLLAHGE